MFGKDKTNKPEDENGMDAPPLKPFSRKGSHNPTSHAQSTDSQTSQPTRAAEPSRRMPDIPGAVRRIDRAGRGMESESKKLTVGRDICLKGEITSCDKLVVEGQVEATMENARIVEVSRTGVFKGAVTVGEADISGRFEGELVAREQLTVRAGGRVTGSIRYGKIVIESGGEISGDMSSLSTDEN